MGHSSVRIKVRRRKVANLAAYSRQHTVRNCTIPKANKNDIIDIKYPWGVVKGTKGGGWDIPKGGYSQPENLQKRTRGKNWDFPSEFPNPQNYQKKLWKNLSKEDKMKAYEDEKVRK